MSLISTLANAIGQKPENVEAQYDQVSQNVPKESLAQGITHAFQSNQTPPSAKWWGRSSTTAIQTSGVVCLQNFYREPRGAGFRRSVPRGAVWQTSLARLPKRAR
jgi:hypothetical protein